MKRGLFVVSFFLIFGVFNLWPENSSVQANYRTSLQCMLLAQKYADSGDWNQVCYYAEAGLEYNDTISDLWYLKALADKKQNKKKFQVISSCTKAIELDNWQNYNRDNARVFYADLLSDTTDYSKVFDILDEYPYIRSADAEYVRIKSYYKLGDKNSINIARSKIDSARQIYADDARFPILFFKNEEPASDEYEVKRLSNLFITQVKHKLSMTYEENEELEIYAAQFAEGNDKLVFLKSFQARGFVHPLYAYMAMTEGLMTQQQAFDYLEPFVSEGISRKSIEMFISHITDESVLQYVRDYFLVYNGIIYDDFDGDGIDNLAVKYLNGRPDLIVFDYNQDENPDYMIECNFGAPMTCIDYNNNLQIQWTEYPYLFSVVAFDEDKSDSVLYELIPNVMSYSPVIMNSDNFISEKIDHNFYFAEIDKKDDLDINLMISSSCRIKVPVSGTENSSIVFSLLNGKVSNAEYYHGSDMYAYCQFEDGYPRLRLVDNDCDGVYEVTEIYENDDGGYSVQSFEEEQVILSNIYGNASNFSSCYLKKIQIDKNGNSIPDYSEEYLPFGGKICSWDIDEDLNWEQRYVKYPNKGEDSVREDYIFYGPLDNSPITITYYAGTVCQFSRNGVLIDVTKDEDNNIYWLGDVGSAELSEMILDAFHMQEYKNVCVVIEKNDVRIMAVYMHGEIYADILKGYSLAGVN